MNRAERRRAQRAHERTPVLIAGDGIVAHSLGSQYEARPHAELPAKEPGRHRWVALGAWVLNDIQVNKAFDPDTRKFLDNENLMHLTIGCWDCEEPLSESTSVDSRCRGEGRS